MSGTVDDEVVRMRFDNNAFERGVSTTLSTLDKLKQALRFPGAAKGLSDVEAKASHLDLSGANKSIDESAHRWSLWQSAAYIAFATVVHRATNAAINVAKAFTTAPISAGFTNYETQINAIQTILANTGLKGASGLQQVNDVLAQLNEYANLTVYNFSEMAKNIGTFTAAGVGLKPAASAIKGIANLAALSGSSSEQASLAMYQLSQAIAANQVKLQDWNSVVNAGLGGKVFQQALFNTGKLEGTLKGVKANETFDQWTKAGNSFRNSLQSGWITGKVLTDTLAQFTGDLTDAQLKSMGYNAQQIKQIQELAKTARGAATNIKTFTQLRQALKEEVASAYGAVFKTIFGDINQATKLFTALHNVIQNALTGPIYKLNDILATAAKFGARTSAISAFTEAFKLLDSILKPIKEGFREIFPAYTGEQLARLINNLDDFIYGLKISGKTADQIKRIFAGFFAIFDIGKQILSAAAHGFRVLFGEMLKGSGGFLEFTARIGDWIVAFDKALKQGKLFTNGMQVIINLVHAAAHIFGIVGTVIAGLFDGFKPKKAFDFNNSVLTAGDVLARLAVITQHIADFFGKLQSKVKPGVDAVVRGIKRIGEVLVQGFNSQTFNNILKLIETGFLGGIVVLLKKFLSHGLSVDLGGGFLEKLGGMLDGVTGNLKAMQQQLKAKALLEIAIAIGILATSLLVLSEINPVKMEASLKAMGVAFGELLGAMAILTKITATTGFVKIPVIALGLGLLAGAILILTAAVYAMSRLSWQQLEKGLTAVGVLLAAVSLATIPLSANSAGIIRASIAINAIAIALNILYVAVRLFASMSWHDMLKGLAGVGIALAGIAIAMRLMPKDMTLQAAALVLIAVALNGIYLAVKQFSKLDWKSLVKGLGSVAATLLIIAGTMHLMPETIAGLIGVSLALNLIAVALKNLSKLSYAEIARGVVALAGSLTVLAGAMYLMTGTLGGASAFLIMATALNIFVPALTALGSIPWSKILKGLGALALTFAVLGTAGLLLTEAIPGMLALGVALGLVGVAMLAFGAGAALLGVGLTAIAASGGAAIGIIMSALKSFIELLPTAAKNLAIAMVTFITILGKNAPKIVGAFVSILTQLLQAVPKIMPSFITAVSSLIVAFLKILTDNAPKVIAAGFELLMDLLQGLENNIIPITNTVAHIIVNFLGALASHVPELVQAGLNLLFKVLEGVAEAAGAIPAEVVKLIAIFLASLLEHNNELIGAGLTMLGHFLSGIFDHLSDVALAATQVVGKFIGGILGWFKDMARLGFNMVKKVVEGIGGAIADVAKAAYDLGKRIFDEILHGLDGLSGGIAGKIKDGVFGGFKIASPFIFGGPPCLLGKSISGAIAEGIDKNAGAVANSIRNVSNDSVLAMKKTMAGLADAISASSVDFTPTITPVLDLSQIQKDAGKINGLVSTKPIVPTISSDQAYAISSDRAKANASDVNADTSLAGVNIKLEQNNFSPKALSTADIYRQTNNQLSKIKKVLGVPIPIVTHQD